MKKYLHRLLLILLISVVTVVSATNLQHSNLLNAMMYGVTNTVINIYTATPIWIQNNVGSFSWNDAGNYKASAQPLSSTNTILAIGGTNTIFQTGVQNIGSDPKTFTVTEIIVQGTTP